MACDAPLPPPFEPRAAPATALRCSSMASGSAVASAPFDVLPEEALRVFFLALPVDARARAACVCRSWRTLLLDSSLWQVLDLTRAGGVAAARVTENLVRGAVARAGGQRACPRYGQRGPAASSPARVIVRVMRALR